MTSSTVSINPATLLNFQSIIENPTFIDDKSKSSKGLSYLFVATVVAGVATAVFHYKLTLASALASTAGAFLLCLWYFFEHRSRPTELTQSLDKIKVTFDTIFTALQTETYFKQQAFLNAFARPHQNTNKDSLTAVLKNYSTFYDNGTDLNDLNDRLSGLGLLPTTGKKKSRKVITISNDPTISMKNYRELLPLVINFLAKNLDPILNTKAPKVVKENLIELRHRCALFIYGQDYRADQEYENTYVRIVLSSGVPLKVAPWVAVELPEASNPVEE